MSAGKFPVPEVIAAAMIQAHQIQVNLANLSPADKRFVTELVALFTDPAKADELAALRRGDVVLGYAPQTGQCQTQAVFMNN